MSDREIMNAKKPPSAREVMKKEYPTIYNAYQDIVDEQFELFCKKHLDYGMHNVSAAAVELGSPFQDDPRPWAGG